MDGAGYIEYHAGTLPLILAAPHGGILQPTSIPNRDPESYLPKEGGADTEIVKQLQISRQVSLRRDQNTKELALLLSSELFALSGQYPHVVINNLSRKKMDANRDIDIAAFGVPEAELAWEQYHQCISQAVETIHHRGLYVDLHGQNHAEKWVELGYLISAKHLDEESFNPSQSSINNLAVHKSMEDVNAFKELLYGASSLGALMDKEGLKVVPSPSYHSPSGGNYFSGGYNTMRYGSQSSAMFDAIQIESPKILRAKVVFAQSIEASC